MASAVFGFLHRSVCHLPRQGFLLTSLQIQWTKTIPLQGVLSSIQLLSGITPCRNSSFFKHVSADQLWDGVSGVSNAGRKKGRGRGRKRRIDLHAGQKLGVGNKPMMWPGLNAPIIKGKNIMQLAKLPPNENQDEEIKKVRARQNTFRVFKIPAMQRGWSGKKFPGMSIGPPDPVDDYTFEGFDTRVLEMKIVANMTATLGRKQRFSAFVVTGNKNGLAGFALAKSATGKDAIRKAKNKAAKRLHFVERHKDHTVLHNIYCNYYATKIMVKKVQPGYGLVCHRVLKTICEVIGIKDLHAKVDSHSKNPQALTKAFFAGLLSQETHQELADRQKLHVVEYRNEMDNIPLLVASPTDKRVLEQIPDNEDLDFENMYYGGKREYIKVKKRKRNRCYKWAYWRKYKYRNQERARVERQALGFEVKKKEQPVLPP